MFDLICMGRAAVDLYGEQIGCPLEDISTFAKYLGGSPANTAVGVARLGLRTAMLSRVGDEQFGRFVRQQLAREGVNVDQVTVDPARLTALVFLAVRDRNHFPHIFYRENCADMALADDDIDPAFIASAKALLISGTQLSQEIPRHACDRAIAAAQVAGTRVVLDIDYRPALWGLAAASEGESRFVASAGVTAQLAALLPACALIAGTEEEVCIAGGADDTLTALINIRRQSSALIVLKRGAAGCIAFPGAIPARLENGVVVPGFAVEVFNVLGAGDAFMAGFLSGWLVDEPLAACCRYANACGAIVVSRHGCSPAMATAAELDFFLARAAAAMLPPRLCDDAELEHIHRTSTRRRISPRLNILAFDHRSQLERIAEDRGAPIERIAAFKALVAEAFLSVSDGRNDTGVLLDDRYGEEVLSMLTGRGVWIARPVEVPGSIPIAFESGPNVGLALRTWPAEHIVKCLVYYHPADAAPLRAQQVARIGELAAACRQTGHELLLEIIPPARAESDAQTVLSALTQLYDAGIRPDWWKLPPSTDARHWHALGRLLDTRDPFCRGMLVLGMEASAETLEASFAAAAEEPWCRGFAVGRSIFADAAAAWFGGGITDADVVTQVACRYRELIALWDRAALHNLSPKFAKGIVS